MSSRPPRRPHAFPLRHPLAASLLILIVALLVSGCGRERRRADLIVGVEAEPASLDPRIGSDVAADRAFHLLYRGLFKTGEDLRPVPDLVESWEQPDATHYVFHLKPGVRFSDGREVTAQDALATLRSILDPSLPSFRKGDLDCIASLSAPGRYRLEITLREPRAAFLSALTVGILPADAVSGSAPPHAHPPGSPSPIGCGPYRLTRWERGQWLLFEANPFASPQPACRTVAFKVIPDPVVRSLELRRGSVDLVVNDLPPDSLAYFANHGYEVRRSPGANYAYVGFNCAHPPLDRTEVRRAIAFAIDRRAILTYILHGYGRLATGLLSPENWAYCGDVESYPFDPARARRLLDAAGLPPDGDGVRFRLIYKTSNNKLSRQIATALAQDLDRVGVSVTVQWLEWGTFYGDVKRGNFDCFGLTWVGITDPDAFRLRFASWALPPEGFNRGRYANREVDDLVEEGAREVDPARRKAIYAQVQKVLAQDPPYVSLWWPDNVAVARPGLEGISLPPDGDFGFLSGVRWREGPPPSR